MASKKSKVIPIGIIQQDLFALLPEAMIASNEALTNFRDRITKIQEAVSSLPASSIEFDDALKMFGLTEGGEATTWSLQRHELYDPPALLSSMQSEIDFVIKGSPQNEAYSRCRLNTILVCCIAEEKRLAVSMAQDTPSAEASAHPTLRPTTPPPEPAQVILRFETELKYPVNYKGEARILSGVADYTLSRGGDESMGTSLILVEAKRLRLTGLAAAQVIAYMGVVHRTRLQQGRQNAVVYGISTDGDEFRFWRIDNDSVVSRSKLYEWSIKEKHRSQITSFIRYIVRAAIASPPTTSPEKDKTAREVSLAAFRDESKKVLFDYGIGGLSLEEEGDEMEVIDCLP